jgi:hypothetical protein
VRLVGWPGHVLVPRHAETPWDELTNVTAERQGTRSFNLKLSVPGESFSFALLSGTHGPADFNTDNGDSFGPDRMIWSAVAYPDQPPPPF